MWVELPSDALIKGDDMSSDCLVLNRSYTAIQVVDWQKAICLIYRDHASVVDEDYRTYSFDEWKEFSQLMSDSPNGFVRSISFKIAVPEIIVLKFYDKLPDSDVRFTRKNIYHHYGYKCCYCGSKFKDKDLNLDHVFPKSKGGRTNWENIVLSCIPCNAAKGNRTPEEANMKQFYKASKPIWRPSYALSVKTNFKAKLSWQKFIDTVYWNSELESN